MAEFKQLKTCLRITHAGKTVSISYPQWEALCHSLQPKLVGQERQVLVQTHSYPTVEALMKKGVVSDWRDGQFSTSPKLTDWALEWVYELPEVPEPKDWPGKKTPADTPPTTHQIDRINEWPLADRRLAIPLGSDTPISASWQEPGSFSTTIGRHLLSQRQADAMFKKGLLEKGLYGVEIKDGVVADIEDVRTVYRLTVEGALWRSK